MTSTNHSWLGTLGAIVVAGVSVASCGSSGGTYDSTSDDPIGTTSQDLTVAGAVGNWTGFVNGQCVAGVYSFFETRFGAKFVGTCAQGTNVGACYDCGACMIWEGSKTEPNPAVWDRYAWGSVMPQTYDMVVYPPAPGTVGYGHVAGVDHINGSNPAAYGSMYVMDSNWYGNEKMATAVHTIARQPYGIYRLKSLANKAPRGYIDSATCSAVSGWTQDQDVPNTAINADIYYNAAAGNSAAVGIRLDADISRSDLCTAIGSCDHGWSMPTPRSEMDSKAHSVYAYGIDSSGGANTLLIGSPLSFTCAPPTIAATAIKRAIPSMTIVTDWAFSTFTDMATYTDAQIALVLDGPAFAAAGPTLEEVTGTTDIYVIDGTERRHVKDMTSFAAWRFTAKMVQSVTAATLDAFTDGLDWPATPLLVKGASATVYLLDDSVAAPAGDGGVEGDGGIVKPGTPIEAGASDDDGGNSQNPADSDAGADNGSAPSNGGGCAISHDTSKSSSGAAWFLAALVGVALVRRSSSRRKSSRRA